MAYKIIPLSSVSSVAPGSTATVDLLIGPTYKKVMFEATGTGLTVGHIGRIRVLIDGKQAQVYKNLERLVDMNTYHGRGGDTAGQFVLHFDRSELVDMSQRRAPGFGTADVQTFTIQIELPSGAPANIAIKGWAHIDTDPSPLGLIYKIVENQMSSSTSGVMEVDKLLRGPWYSCIHFFKPDISNVEVEVGSTRVIDAPKSVLERLQRQASPVAKVPMTSKATTLDMLLEGNMFDSLMTQGLKEFRLKITLDSPGSVEIVSETLDALVGL